MRVEIRPAIAADFLALQGKLPPHRSQCLTAVADGQVIGIGGFIRFPSGEIGASVLMVDHARRFRAAIHRAGILAMQLARREGYPRVYATAQDGLAGAEPWLKRLGFRRTDGLATNGKPLFVWECPPDVE